jgi:hypothetical protein
LILQCFASYASQTLQPNITKKKNSNEIIHNSQDPHIQQPKSPNFKTNQIQTQKIEM